MKRKAPSSSSPDKSRLLRAMVVLVLLQAGNSIGLEYRALIVRVN